MAQNGQKMTLRGDKGAQGTKKEAKREVNGAKKYTFGRSKRSQNPSKNVFENIMVFKSLSGSILGSILHQNGTPKGQI